MVVPQGFCPNPRGSLNFAVDSHEPDSGFSQGLFPNLRDSLNFVVDYNEPGGGFPTVSSQFRATREISLTSQTSRVVVSPKASFHIHAN